MSASNPQEEAPKRLGGMSRTPGSMRTPGTRTPRKVQWMDERDEGRQSLDGSVHLLDPHGQDDKAFNALTDALERHRRETPITPLTKVHYYPPRPADSLSPSSSLPSIDNPRHQTDSYDSSDMSNFASTSALPSRAPSPVRDIPGNVIDSGEDAGLPGTHDLRSYAKRKAAKIVHMHTRGWKRQARRHSPTEQPGSSNGDKHTHDIDGQYFSGKSSDVEGHNRGNIGSSYGGGDGSGILSTLLRLYDHPSSDFPSGPSSGFSSGTATPLSHSLQRDLQNESREGWESPRSIRPKEPVRPSQFDHESRKKSRIPLPRLTIPSLGLLPRPAHSRSAAGVFGPLIASTGNLEGIGAPYHSRLQPNIERPGYRLSRYSIKNTSAKQPSLTDTPDKLRSLPDMDSNPSILSGTTPPLSPSSAQSIHRHNGKANVSGMFGTAFPYVSSIRSSGRRSGASTPRSITPTADAEERFHNSPGRKERRRKRKKVEVFITRHVAQIIRREEFILKLTRAMMMFGGPSHRLQSQIQSAARVLDINLSFMYFPDVVLISFDDPSTGTSHIKLIRQASALDLGKLGDAYHLYWKVIHDKLSVSDASIELDALMQKRPLYNWRKLMFIGGMCSASICTVSFEGSFVDALISFPLGTLLIAVQLLSVRNVLYSYVFEFTITMLFSFIAAALAATHKICYSAVASSSVVLILPGFLVLNGALELMSRNIVSGSVRLCYAAVYALFLGFGFAIGAECFELFTGAKVYGAEDYACSASHDPSGPWYQRTPVKLWAFLTVPMFSLFLSMKNQTPWDRKEMLLLVGIASIGWVTNYFTGTRFVGQSDIIAAVGAFAVGLVANVYARIFSGNAFVIMITGILFQLPSGLGSGGLLSYASEQTAGSANSYISGFRTALKLISVAIGLTMGLGLALVVAHPIQSKKREAGIFSL